MNILRILIAACFVFASFDAMAECTTKWCDNVYVERIYVRANGTISIATTGTESLLNCTPYQGVYVTLDQTAENAAEIYSLLLAAQLADKQFKVRIVESSSDCRISYVTLNRQ